VPETPEELYARVRSEGLRMPLVQEWETWPFEGELQPRALQPPVDVEAPRVGEEAAECWRCQKGVENAIWSDERWLLTPIPEPEWPAVRRAPLSAPARRPRRAERRGRQAISGGCSSASSVP